MKKYLLLILAMALFLGMSESADAGIYLFGNVGGGDNISYGGDLGVIWPGENPKYLLGIGASTGANSETKRATIYLDKVKSSDLEIYGAFGYGFLKNLFIVGTAGATEVCEGIAIKGDDASSCASYEDNKTEYRFSGSGQLRYVYKHLIIGAGYHNRRGIIGGIGFMF
jgi:hypothetical protein